MRDVSPFADVRSARDGSDWRASQAVIEAVAEAKDVDPVELSQPLFEVVDPDALDQFFGFRPRPGHQSIRRVTFAYMGYRVTIHPDGDIEVAAGPADDFTHGQ